MYDFSKALVSLEERLNPCILCPRRCGVLRLEGERGVCKVGVEPKIAGYEAHFGEEACLVGHNGSGAVFFSGCNLACVFCQTYEISHKAVGEEISYAALAEIFLSLAEQGVHNINLVSPSHQVYAIVKALEIARREGLSLPVVYNTGGYDSQETLALLEGLVDIYLADFKVWHEDIAARLLKAPDYPEVAREALKEMYRQVGDLVIDKKGLAQRGLLVRHLVLPGGLAGTREILRFLKEEISPRVYLNLMGHYHPAGEAMRYPPLDRPLQKKEFEEAIRWAQEFGFTRLDKTHWALLAFILDN